MADRRTGDIASELAEHVGELVREEMRVAGRELKEKAAKVGGGGALLCLAAALMLYAGGVAVSSLVLLLARLMPAWLAALLTSALLVGAAAVAGLAGVDAVRRSLPLLPGRAAEDLATAAEAAAESQRQD